MRRRRHRQVHPPPSPNHDRWLVSYADFITLLFAFFVVLFATTRHSNQEIRSLSGAIRDGFIELGAHAQGDVKTGLVPVGVQPDTRSSKASPITAARPAPTPSLEVVDVRKELESALGDSIQKQEIVMQQTPEGFVISLQDLGFFTSGGAHLLPGAADKITRMGQILMVHGLELRVEGHSDDQQIHNALFHSNWELSAARAMSVFAMLVDQAGFDPRRISVAGYGQYRPVTSNATAEGRSLNRRVDLVVVAMAPAPQPAPLSAPGVSKPSPSGPLR